VFHPWQSPASAGVLPKRRHFDRDMEITELLKTKVSYLEYFWADIREAKLSSVLNEIRSDKHRGFTEYLRQFYSQGEKDSYAVHKKRLPVVTFCGSFEKGRTKDCLKDYSYLVVLDIDKLDCNELCRIKDALSNDKYVFSFWESPSKAGIKGLVHLEYTFDIYKNEVDYSHKATFSQLIKYFKEEHNIELDRSGSDITRLCFISSDRMLVLKDTIVSFKVDDKACSNICGVQTSTARIITATKGKGDKNALYNPSGKNRQYHRTVITRIIKYLRRNSLSITYRYEEWIRVSYAISNSFTYDIGLKYFVDLCKLDKDKFDEYACTRLLINCYETSRGQIGFSTIIHYASEKGFKFMDAKST